MICNDLYTVFIYIYIYTVYIYIYIYTQYLYIYIFTLYTFIYIYICGTGTFFTTNQPNQSVELRKRCVAKRQWLPEAWLSCAKDNLLWHIYIYIFDVYIYIYIYIVHMCRSHEHKDFSIHRYLMLLNWKTPPDYSVRLLVVSENPTSHYRLIWFRWCPSYGFVWKQDPANIGFELLMNWCKTFWNPTIHHN